MRLVNDLEQAVKLEDWMSETREAREEKIIHNDTLEVREL
jgi:hypothetical protein